MSNYGICKNCGDICPLNLNGTCDDGCLPPCDCGNPKASWHGDKHGRRKYCCDKCWRNRLGAEECCMCGKSYPVMNLSRDFRTMCAACYSGETK